MKWLKEFNLNEEIVSNSIIKTIVERKSLPEIINILYPNKNILLITNTNETEYSFFEVKEILTFFNYLFLKKYYQLNDFSIRSSSSFYIIKEKISYLSEIYNFSENILVESHIVDLIFLEIKPKHIDFSITIEDWAKNLFLLKPHYIENFKKIGAFDDKFWKEIEYIEKSDEYGLI